MKNINIVLVEPEIPQNTGNISRTCACTGAALHLVRPLGFEISDKYLKRAGLDYWHLLDITYYDSIDDFLEKTASFPKYFLTTKAKKCYSDIAFPDNCFIVFGKETRGLPERLIYDNLEAAIRIPMSFGARSLNLSNSVAIITYEILRQNSFVNLKTEGELTEF